MARLTVLGIGNILMRDEGVGVRLMEAVRDARRWPEGVEFIDGGVGGLNLLDVIESAERMIVFDAAEMDLPPCESRVISPEQVSDQGDEPRVSLHQMPFIETLRLCEEFLTRPAEVTILAIQPKDVDYGRELSEQMTAAFDGLVQTGLACVAAAVGMTPPDP